MIYDVFMNKLMSELRLIASLKGLRELSLWKYFIFFLSWRSRDIS